MSDLPTALKRIDEHNTRITNSEMGINNIQFRLLHVEQEGKSTKALLEQLIVSVDAIRLVQAEERGAKAATKTSVNYTFEIVKLIPILAAFIALYLHK